MSLRSRRRACKTHSNKVFAIAVTNSFLRVERFTQRELCRQPLLVNFWPIFILISATDLIYVPRRSCVSVPWSGMFISNKTYLYDNEARQLLLCCCYAWETWLQKLTKAARRYQTNARPMLWSLRGWIMYFAAYISGVIIMDNKKIASKHLWFFKTKQLSAPTTIALSRVCFFFCQKYLQHS